jgi:hypothetical protein
VVEGSIRAARRNQNHDTFKVIEHIAGRNPQHLKASVCKYRIALDVALRPIAHRMDLTVDFDGEPTLQTGEVDHISIVRKLPAKSQAIWTPAKLLPKHDFR